ncbi:cytochrome c oxidase accessory protein CcoG [Thiohalophilus thiocyanatoxydans]|uniref:Cytochrome c oxidase accessory protein FixG n=1 Tax=Thiohalophilus thiocyanatoxydans TaxID=381308 RepID=A0A4R8J1N8_9GAMM|nr:cytochrome c oxidase accessory protein CcoG [Thiohalophilus thiocyanatoxydans]TDY04099.1 cytochrome c oxidase accessory protein FixG [Thiohalophilus thiocyanatoxydans]
MTQTAYQSRIPIYPRSVKGRFRTIKYAVLALAYGVYFLLPWLRWERESGPTQAVLFDLAGRHFYLFDLVVYAQDIFWLAGVLVIFALLMFFVTGLAGRVFCGYFCFQTLWTDVYILIERLVQGERNARIKLAEAPWSKIKFFKLGMTHLLWLVMAFVTGLTFVLYWGNAPELVLSFFRGEAPFAAYATTLFLTATTYVMAGLAREQVCTYMCPYARFQAVMFDRDTLIVAYDEQRGEREQGRHKPSRDYMEREARIADKVGDCIDCGYCVQVCPVGIDIRNGLQYQCISCALCIDACDTIMDSIGYPRGLIRYTSQKALEGEKSNLFNLKNTGYALVLLAAIGMLVWAITHRDMVELSVAQFRQPLSVTLSDGRIQNRYEIKINNKTSQSVRYRISIEGLPRAELDLSDDSKVTIGPENSLKLIAKVNRRPESAKEGRETFDFVIHQLDSEQPLESRRTTFFYTP